MTVDTRIVSWARVAGVARVGGVARLAGVAWWVVVVGLVMVALAAATLRAGPLTPPAGPVVSTPKPLAEIEPRIAINATNTPGDATAVFVISQPGSYYLTGNIVIASSGPTLNGIAIRSGHVTLDLNGYALIGEKNRGLDAIDVGTIGAAPVSNVVIRNGRISNWLNGIDALITSGRIEHLTITTSRHRGINLPSTTSQGSGVVVADCTLSRNGTAAGGTNSRGIDAVAYVTIERCRIDDQTGIGISVLNFCTVRDCSVTNITSATGSAASVLTMYGTRCVVMDNVLMSGPLTSRAVDIEGDSNTLIRNILQGSVVSRGTNHAIGPFINAAGVATATNPLANLQY